MVRLPHATLRSTNAGHSSSPEWSDRPRLVPLFLAIVLATTVTMLTEPGSKAQDATPGALSENSAMSPVVAASEWLRGQQDASGGFLGLSGEPDPGTTTDAAIALYADGLN